MRNARVAGVLGWVLAAAAIPAAAADSPWGRVLQPDSIASPERYVIYYRRAQAREYYVRTYLELRRRSDPRAGDALSADDKAKIVAMFREDVQMLFKALAKASKFYGDAGFAAPTVEAETISDRVYHRLYYQDFGPEQVRVAGKVMGKYVGGAPAPDCRMGINLRRLIEYRKVGRQKLIAVTAAHELFHAIQWHYCPIGDPWMKESTATWAANQVFAPYVSHVEHMSRYILFMQRPLTFDSRPAGSMLYSSLDEDGRPYGAAVWWHFLDRHHPSATEVVRKTLEGTSRTAPALAALAAALGDGATVGDHFRDYFDRFAIGAFLTDQAPEECRLRDAEKYPGLPGARQREFRVQPNNPVALNSVLAGFYQDLFTTPESASFQIDWSDGAPGVSGRRFVFPAALGRIAGCGTRYFLVQRPDAAPDDAPLDVLVKAGKEELSLQAMLKTGGRWSVFKGQFSEPAGGYVLRVPYGLGDNDATILAVTRYSADEAGKAFGLQLASADPPRVRRVRLSQGDRTVCEVQWEEQADGAGLAVARTAKTGASAALDPAAGGAKIEVEFSCPVKSAGQPICQINGRTVATEARQDGLLHVGTVAPGDLPVGAEKLELRVLAVSDLAGTHVALPLDENPDTPARLSPADWTWTGYERTGAGQAIPLSARGKPPEVKLAMGPTFADTSNDWVVVACDALPEIRKSRGGAYRDLIVFGADSPDGPWTKRAGQVEYLMGNWPKAVEGQQSTGWLDERRFQLPVSPKAAMAVIDPATHQPTGYIERPPYYRAALMVYSEWAKGGESATPVAWSNVIGPEAPVISIVRSGGKPDTGPVEKRIGDGLLLTVRPGNMDYHYDHVRIKATFGGVTHYVFTSQWPGSFGLANATLAIPRTATPPAVVTLEATADGKTVQRTAQLVYPDKELADHQAAMQKAADYEEKERQWRLAGVTGAVAAAQREIDQAQAALDNARKYSADHPDTIAAAEKRLADAQEKMKWDGLHATKEEEVRHAKALAYAHMDPAARTDALTREMALKEELFANKPTWQRGDMKKTAQGSLRDGYFQLANAAKDAGDIEAYRQATAKALQAEEALVASGGSSPPVLASYYRTVADGLALLTGETAESKALWLKAHQLVLTRDERGAKYEQRDWDAGRRPSWWPGD